MQNLYVSLQEAQDQLNNQGQVFNAGDQRVMLRLLDMASRQVEQDCNRWFFAYLPQLPGQPAGAWVSDAPRLRASPTPLLSERLFLSSMPVSTPYVVIPDLVTPAKVELDVNGDGTFSQTLTQNVDYALRSLDSGLPPVAGMHAPYDRIDLLTSPIGLPSFALPRGLRLRVTGTFGYTDAAEAVACTVTLADAITTAMTSSAAADLAIGQTLLVGSEQVFIAGGAGTSWTVLRGVNGTTAAPHTTVAPLRYVYVPGVKEAVIILAGRVFERRHSLFANTLQAAGMTTMKMWDKEDPDYQRCIRPYARTFDAVTVGAA